MSLLCQRFGWQVEFLSYSCGNSIDLTSSIKKNRYGVILDTCYRGKECVGGAKVKRRCN